MSADGRRAATAAVIGLGCGLVVGVVLWLATHNTALSFGVGGTLGLLLSGSGAAVSRRKP